MPGLHFVYNFMPYCFFCKPVILCISHQLTPVSDICYQILITICIFIGTITDCISLIVISERQKNKKILIGKYPLIICIAEIYSKLKLIRLEFTVTDK